MCEKDWFAQDVHKIWDFFSIIRPTKCTARLSKHKRNTFKHRPSEQSASFTIDKKSIIWKKHLNKPDINFKHFFSLNIKKTPKQRKQIFLILSFIIHKKKTQNKLSNLFSPYLIFHYKNKALQTEKQSHSSFCLPSSRKRKNKQGAEQGTRKRKASHSHHRHRNTTKTAGVVVSA